MTKIEWADESWNPIGLVGGGHGCAKVSPGCANCYAETMSKRFWNTPPYDRRSRNYELRDPDFKKLKKFKDGSIVFVQSMSDLFHWDVPVEYHLEVFEAAQRFPNLNLLWLTKHPKRMNKLLQYGKPDEPLPNLWLGVTAENQKQADKRIPILLQTSAAKRFVSVEPMLGPVDLQLDAGVESNGSQGFVPNVPLDWVIIGCESGPKRRPMDNLAAIDLVKQCQEANVAVFVKQVELCGKVCKDISHFPPDLQVRQFPTEVREEA